MDQKDDIYCLYKPLRNYLKQFSLMDSLGVIRAYLQYMQFGQKFPNNIQVDKSFILAKSRLESGVYEWQLETLAKEIILNTDTTPSNKTLSEWRYFSSVLNKLKDLENNISIHYNGIFKKQILIELYRTSHRQFPWQARPNLISLTRYYKIFNHPDIDSIIQKHTGLTTKELYTIGLAFTGVYIEFFALHYPPELQILGITQEKVDKFLKHFSTDMESIKKLIHDSQSYDYDYAYTLSPLKITPLIRTIHNGRYSIIAPVPTFLFKRFTDGIYYEICKDPDFANPFGNSFQSYIGEVIDKSDKDKRFKFFKETEYFVGKDRKDTADWIVLDNTANLFIECKTKRLKAIAKITLEDNSALEEELNLMADFIVQVYATIIDYRSDHYKEIKNNNKPCFPVIVTLEEWYAFGDKIISKMLDKKVKSKLEERKFDTTIMEKEPYTICSAGDFNIFAQIINLVDIQKFMSEKTVGEYRLWALASFMFNKYPREHNLAVDLFPEDYKEIHPAVASA